MTNSDYELALNNKDNLAIMRKVSWKYRNLDPDEIHSATLIALWKCLKSYNPDKGAKFTTSLYRYLVWECNLVALRKKRKERIKTIPITKEVRDNIMLPQIEILDCLSPKHKYIIVSRFVEKKTLSEIANDIGCCIKTLREEINRAKNKIVKELGVKL